MSVFGNALYLVLLEIKKKKKDSIWSSKHSQFSVEIRIFSFVASYKVLIFVSVMYKAFGVQLCERRNFFLKLRVSEYQG